MTKACSLIELASRNTSFFLCGFYNGFYLFAFCVFFLFSWSLQREFDMHKYAWIASGCIVLTFVFVVLCIFSNGYLFVSLQMKPRPLLIAFGIHCLIYTVSYAVNPGECHFLFIPISLKVFSFLSIGCFPKWQWQCGTHIFPRIVTKCFIEWYIENQKYVSFSIIIVLKNNTVVLENTSMINVSATSYVN